MKQSQCVRMKKPIKKSSLLAISLWGLCLWCPKADCMDDNLYSRPHSTKTRIEGGSLKNFPKRSRPKVSRKLPSISREVIELYDAKGQPLSQLTDVKAITAVLEANYDENRKLKQTPATNPVSLSNPSDLPEDEKAENKLLPSHLDANENLLSLPLATSVRIEGSSLDKNLKAAKKKPLVIGVVPLTSDAEENLEEAHKVIYNKDGIATHELPLAEEIATLVGYLKQSENPNQENPSIGHLSLSTTRGLSEDEETESKPLLPPSDQNDNSLKSDDKPMLEKYQTLEED